MGPKSKAPPVPPPPSDPFQNENFAVEMDNIVNHSKFLLAQMKRSREIIELLKKMKRTDKISPEDANLITNLQRELNSTMKNLDDITKKLVTLIGLPLIESEGLDVTRHDLEKHGVGPIPNQGMGILNKVPKVLVAPLKSGIIPFGTNVSDADLAAVSKYKPEELPLDKENTAVSESTEDASTINAIEVSKDCYKQLPNKTKVLNRLEKELKKRQITLQNINYENEKLKEKLNLTEKINIEGQNRDGSNKSEFVQEYTDRLNKKINEINKFQSLQTFENEMMRNSFLDQVIRNKLKSIVSIENIVSKNNKVVSENGTNLQDDIKKFLDIAHRSEDSMNFDDEYQDTYLKEQKKQGRQLGDDSLRTGPYLDELMKTWGRQMKAFGIPEDSSLIPDDETIFRTKSEMCCKVGVGMTHWNILNKPKKKHRQRHKKYVCEGEELPYDEKLKLIQQFESNNEDRNRYFALLTKLKDQQGNIDKLEKAIRKLASLMDPHSIKKKSKNKEKIVTNDNKMIAASDRHEEVMNDLGSKQNKGEKISKDKKKKSKNKEKIERMKMMKIKRNLGLNQNKGGENSKDKKEKSKNKEKIVTNDNKMSAAHDRFKEVNNRGSKQNKRGKNIKDKKEKSKKKKKIVTFATNNEMRAAPDKYREVINNHTSKQNKREKISNDCKLMELRENAVTLAIEKLEKDIKERETSRLVIQAEICLLTDHLMNCQENNRINEADGQRLKENLKELIKTIKAKKQEFVDKKALIEKLNLRIEQYEKKYPHIGMAKRLTC